MGCCNQSTCRWPWLILLIVAVIVVLLAVFSDARGQTPPDKAIALVANMTCPVTTDEPIDPDEWMEYEGRRVYFCCRMCRRKFERQPRAYLANLPAFANANATVEGLEQRHGETEPVPGNHVHEIHNQVESDAGRRHEATDQGRGEDGSAEHNHADHENDMGDAGLTRLVTWLGKFHPLMVHFPIALLMAGALAELLHLITRREFYLAPAQFTVWLGSATAVMAAVLGWFFGGFKLVDEDWLMAAHRWFGTTTALWAIVLMLLCVLGYSRDGSSKRGWYVMALFAGAALVGAAGFFGGALVYGLDHLAW